MEYLIKLIGYVVAVILGYIFGRLTRDTLPKGKDVQEKLTSEVVRVSYFKKILTVYYANNDRKQYYGSSTVWHTYPEMVRCGVLKEGELSNYNMYIKVHGKDWIKDPKLVVDNSNATIGSITHIENNSGDLHIN